MCIIAVYNKQSKIERATIERMARTNPDGIGIAYNDGKRVYWLKGITEAGDAYHAIKNAQKNGAQNIVFHARIATSGGISAEKCHPYPLTSDTALLNKTQGATRGAVVFHNGIFKINIEKGLNDTQTFVKNCLAPIREELTRGRCKDLLEMAVSGCRLAILFPDRVDLFGTWLNGDGDGVKYSNTGFREYRTTYASRYEGTYWKGKDGRWRFIDDFGRVKVWDDAISRYVLDSASTQAPAPQKKRVWDAETRSWHDLDEERDGRAYLRGESSFDY